MRQVYIVGAARTPIGRVGGALSALGAVDLGRIAVTAALERAGVAPADVQQLVMGQVIQAGAGSNPARQVSLLAGLPVSIPSFTVNMVCASGMKAVQQAAQAVACGESDLVVAGGMESMSGAPYLLDRARSGYRLGDGTLLDSITRDALQDPLGRYHMALTAETLAEEMAITRAEQDAFSLESQRKAADAMRTGAFKAEIAEVELPPARRGAEPVRVLADEHPRPDTSAASLAALKPAFKEGGTVTPGNASGINDGAAALVLASESAVRSHGLVPMATVAACAACGVEPQRMGLGPVPATRAALAAAGLTLADIDLVELNEAFAAQALAVIRQLGLDAGRVNVNGGAIALGHPVGASGARILVTLLYALKARGKKRGLATLCVGGGQGMACVVSAA